MCFDAQTLGVGLAAIMAAKLTSPKHLIVIETVSSKLAFATKYGATHVINGLQENVQQRIMEITGGKGVDFALDCVGRQDILKLGQACLVAKGCLITVGGLGGQDVVLYGDSIITKGLTYRGCHQGDSVPQLVSTQFSKNVHLSHSMFSSSPSWSTCGSEASFLWMKYKHITDLLITRRP